MKQQLRKKTVMFYLSRLFIPISLLVIALLGTGCARPVQAQVAQITIRAGDHFFEAPAQVQAGLLSITFENVGQEAHHMQIVELHEGVTPEQFQTAFPQAAEQWTPERMAHALSLIKRAAGGPGLIPPGKHQRVTLKLAPGRYLLFCIIPDHAGVPHLAQGMMATLDVTGQAPAIQPEPAADATVTLSDFSFVLPQRIQAGKQTWKIVNEGEQLHELLLWKLAEGKTVQDVIAFQQAPHGTPPYLPAGGFQGIGPGGSGWLYLDLEPGSYVAICPIPDSTSGTPHHELGMILPFTVE
jgi:uncharacterized cupredoxin-like copper-binding protein